MKKTSKDTKTNTGEARVHVLFVPPGSIFAKRAKSWLDDEINWVPQNLQVFEEAIKPTGVLDSNGDPIVRKKGKIGFDLG